MCWNWGKSKKTYDDRQSGNEWCASKKLWSTIKSLLPNEIVSNEKIAVIEKEKIIKSNK